MRSGENLSNYTFDATKFKNFIQDSYNYVKLQNIITKLKSLQKLLNKFGPKISNFNPNKLKEIILNIDLAKSCKNFKAYVKNTTVATIFRANLEYEIGSLKYLDELNKEGLFFSTINGAKVTTVSSSFTILAKAEDVYIDVNGLVSKKNLTFYTNAEGKLFYLVEEVVNGAGSSLFGKNVVAGINGFSDNITTLASQQGINLVTFKNIEELSVADLLQTQNLSKINSIRNNIPLPDATTLMQKVIPKSDIQKYVSGQYKSCKGFMSTAKDSKHLNTYDDIYYGMRLDYQGSAFSISDGSCGVIRFKAPNANTAIVPRSSNNILAGVDDAPFPYTGHGFTSGTNGRLGVPEWKMSSFADLQNGEAELYEVFSNGSEVLKARFDKQLGQFVSIQ